MWARYRINEARKERDKLTMKVEELNELVVELTTRLNQGENQFEVWKGSAHSVPWTSTHSYIDYRGTWRTSLHR